MRSRPQTKETMKTIAIGSGKGGVGKTSLTANLTVLLSRQGHRVVAMDADFGLANLDVMMGLSPGPTLRDLIEGKGRVEDVLRHHSSGARVLAGCSGVAELADMSPRHLDNLLTELHRLEVSTDVLLVDVAAGVHETAIATLAAADEAVVVMNGDPSSFVDAYATIKRLNVANPNALIRLVINEVDDSSRGKLLFARMQAVVREHLEARIIYAGSLRRDDAMARAVLLRDVVVDRSPDAPVTADLIELAETLAPGGLRLERTRTSFFTRLLGFGSRVPRVA